MSLDCDKPTGQVRSLTRALRLLRQLGERGEGMTLSELAEAVSLPPSTTHRLLTTLEAERFVRPDPQGGLWRVGVAAFHVGAAFARTRDRLELARPYLAEASDATGETASLMIESAGEALCIDQIESSHAVRAVTGLGGRVPLHCTASGKALLAHGDPGRVRAVIGRDGLERHTDATITDPRRLEDTLAEVRALGYALDDEEYAAGLRCAAAPILDATGRVLAAISISGPTARIPSSRLASLGRLMAQLAVSATRDHGGDASLAAQ
jgi:IclR family acetate operon transcriptional repressor